MTAHLILGDCRESLTRFPENLIDACVTDPPYHLTSIVKRFGKPGSAPAKDRDGVFQRASGGFMGQTWDGGDVAMRPETWEAVLRVLKPGAHLVAFGGTRTFHRVACAIEDAGFEIRDTVMWVYGSGFPKSHDAGDGWGTALKPAWEPIILARKPLIGTVAENAQRHGTGAINIDGCRIEGGETITTHSRGAAEAFAKRPGEKTVSESGRVTPQNRPEFVGNERAGRWPANLIHDGSEEVLEAFPTNVKGAVSNGKLKGSGYGEGYGEMRQVAGYADAGTAARFFYCAKASRSDRNEGCEDLGEQPLNWSSGEQSPGTFQSAGTKKAAKNNHPTVKPTALMRYLCKLVTPPKGIVLDPFMGSGSTGKAAILEGYQFIGMEMNEPYIEIARRRVGGDVKVHRPAKAA